MKIVLPLLLAIASYGAFAAEPTPQEVLAAVKAVLPADKSAPPAPSQEVISAAKATLPADKSVPPAPPQEVISAAKATTPPADLGVPPTPQEVLAAFDACKANGQPGEIAFDKCVAEQAIAKQKEHK